MIQLAITAIDNKNLFSNYYLDKQIKNIHEWTKDDLIDQIVYRNGFKWGRKLPTCVVELNSPL